MDHAPMRIGRLISAVSILLVFGISARAQVHLDILQYGVGKTKNHVQVGPGAPEFADFTFNAFVDLREGGALAGAVLKGPLVGGQQALTLNSGGLDYTSASFNGEPTTAKGNLNSNFKNTDHQDPNTRYRLQIDVGTPSGSPEFDVILDLVGDSYADAAPVFVLDNGDWTAGTYFVDGDSVTNFGWNLASYNAETDIVLFDVKSAGGATILDEQFRGTQPGGFSLAANSLTMGESYTVRLAHARVVSQDIASIPGALGVAFYAVETTLNIQVIPEPSTYGLLGLGLIAVLLPMLRRRAAR